MKIGCGLAGLLLFEKFELMCGSFESSGIDRLCLPAIALAFVLLLLEGLIVLISKCRRLSVVQIDRVAANCTAMRLRVTRIDCCLCKLAIMLLLLVCSAAIVVALRDIDIDQTTATVIHHYIL